MARIAGYAALACLLSSTAWGTDRTWTGNGGNALASTAGNWSPSGSPGTADRLTFDNTCTNCAATWDVATSVDAIMLKATYTNTVTCSAGVVLSGWFDWLGGTFTCTGYSVTFSGGNTYGALTYAGDFNAASGASSVVIAKDSGGNLWTLVAGTTLTATMSAATTRITVQAGATLIASGNVAMENLIASGTFNASAASTFSARHVTVNSGGAFTAASGTMTVSGNWTNNGGTFNHSNGTVTFSNVDHSFTGSTTFYNLSNTALIVAQTWTFAAGTTQTVTHSCSLQGGASKLLSIISSSAGTAWHINCQGSRTLGYLSVKDSYNDNATTMYAGTTSTLVSGNTGWSATDPPAATPRSYTTIF